MSRRARAVGGGVTPWPQICLHGVVEPNPCGECSVGSAVETRGAVVTPWESFRLTPDDSQYIRGCDTDRCPGKARWLFARWKNGKRERRHLCLTDAAAFAKRWSMKLED